MKLLWSTTLYQSLFDINSMESEAVELKSVVNSVVREPMA